MVSIELVEAYCLPLLLYNVEATAPSRQVIQMMDRCVDVSRRFLKYQLQKSVHPSDNYYYVGFEHVAELIKKRKCKFTNYLVACRFDFEVLQLDFTELFAFAS